MQRRISVLVAGQTIARARVVFGMKNAIKLGEAGVKITLQPRKERLTSVLYVRGSVVGSGSVSSRRHEGFHAAVGQLVNWAQQYTPQQAANMEPFLESFWRRYIENIQRRRRVCMYLVLRAVS